jgi:DNA-binding NtrC family response regulator
MNGNLLIVDDEELLLDVLKYSMKRLADNVFTASNGADALKILKHETIHCIVCDINMPEMNGMEVLRNLRAMNFSTPFIFYTGNGNRELMKEAQKLGAMDFMEKPGHDGLEEVVTKGLRSGLNPDTHYEITFESEYTQMIKEQNRAPKAN